MAEATLGTRPVWTGSDMLQVPRRIETFDDLPGWVSIACTCCAGIAWGGVYPVECDRCGGTGGYWIHIESGTAALYPGGPFTGEKVDPEQIREALKQHSTKEE